MALMDDFFCIFPLVYVVSPFPSKFDNPITDGYVAQHSTRAFPESLNLYAIPVVLLLYSILHDLVKLKGMVIGPSNWTTCLRKLLVYHDRTLEGSNGQDCTFHPLHPNFTDLIPVLPGHMDYPIPSSFCQPGRHLYLLTSPVSMSAQPVSSIHIYAFGATSNVPDGNHEENQSQDSSSWLSCAIVRRSKDDGELVEVAPSHVQLVATSRGVTESSSPAEYSAIHVFDSDDFTRKIKAGDMIALWAHSYPGRLHTLRQALVKVNSMMQDALFLYLLHKLTTCLLRLLWHEDLPECSTGYSRRSCCSRSGNRYIWVASTCLSSSVLSAICFTGRILSECIFLPSAILILNRSRYFSCEGWVWANLTAVARTMHASSMPLSLPPDPTSVVVSNLPAFIQERTSTAETITSDILSASLRSMELFHEKSGKEIVLVSFSHRNVDYVIHIIGPSAVHAGWLHYLSFVSTPHRLEGDEVKIFRDGDTERIARESFVDQSILQIQFKTGENICRKEMEFELRLRSIVKLLQGMEKHYWWYFWLNSRYWTWQWWLLHTVLRETAGSHEYIEVEGHRCSHDGAATLLKDRYKQWRYAFMKDYSMCSVAILKIFWLITLYWHTCVVRGLPSLDDVLFITTQTRSIWIVLFIFTCSRAFDWCIHTILF